MLASRITLVLVLFATLTWPCRAELTASSSTSGSALTPASREQEAHLRDLHDFFKATATSLKSEKASGNVRYPVVEKGYCLDHGAKVPTDNKLNMCFTGDRQFTVRMEDPANWKETRSIDYDEIWQADGASGWVSRTYWKSGEFQLAVFLGSEDLLNPKLFVTTIIERDWFLDRRGSEQSSATQHE